ncbi:MAG: hypothetical protein MUF10_02350 [Thermoanaerobaculaceae bacterium]|jgi:hypothetical protein|nr:hypothetical protein [Thermoanaerobaculaceae bacterium]
MPQNSVILVILGLVAVLGVVWALTLANERKRRDAIAAKALEMGLRFAEDAAYFVESAPPFKLFSRGRRRKARNLLSGSRSGIDITIADYQFTVSSGKNSHTHRQTICLLRARGTELPHCFLRREVALLDAIGERLGGQDIDFPEDPDFSRAFVLQGADPEATRRLFGGAVRTHLMRHAGTRIELEAGGDALLLHRGGRVKPDELRELLEHAAEAFRLLRQG